MTAMVNPRTFRWPRGAQCAVSLTYDDAVAVHHKVVAPMLAEKGLTATFNLSCHGGVTEEVEQWRRVADLGHELGNHTLFHPCRRDPPGRYAWLSPEYDLCDYTVERWTDEIRVANCLLRPIDGRSERTFGNTCCHTSIGRGDQEVQLDDLILRYFVAGRGPCNGRIVDPTGASFGGLGHLSGDRKTMRELGREIEQAVYCGGWIIYMFHGVGEGTHKSFIEADQHELLVDFLAGNPERIWTASMVEVATYLKAGTGGAEVG